MPKLEYNVQVICNSCKQEFRGPSRIRELIGTQCACGTGTLVAYDEETADTTFPAHRDSVSEQGQTATTTAVTAESVTSTRRRNVTMSKPTVAELSERVTGLESGIAQILSIMQGGAADTSAKGAAKSSTPAIPEHVAVLKKGEALVGAKVVMESKIGALSVQVREYFKGDKKDGSGNWVSFKPATKHVVTFTNGEGKVEVIGWVQPELLVKSK